MSQSSPVQQASTQSGACTQAEHTPGAEQMLRTLQALCTQTTKIADSVPLTFCPAQHTLGAHPVLLHILTFKLSFGVQVPGFLACKDPKLGLGQG